MAATEDPSDMGDARNSSRSAFFNRLRSLRHQRQAMPKSSLSTRAEALLPEYATMLDQALDLAEAAANKQLDPDQEAGAEPAPTAQTPADPTPAPPWSSWPGEHEIFHFPGPVTNPFVGLLYRDAATHKLTMRNLGQLADLPDGSARRTLHIHWTSRLQAGCTSAEAAALRSSTALEQMRRWQHDGGRVIWSVHEPLPHDCRFPKVETRFRQDLAALADVVHVLHPSTIEACAPFFTIAPDRATTSAHPLYTGVYPNWMSRSEARARLGVGDEFVMLAFGSIRPYKRLDRVVAAHRQMVSSGRRARLIIAGPHWKSAGAEDILTAGDHDDSITIVAETVPDDDVQLLFRAADLVPIAYDDFLNSGVLMLAVTFGTPTLAPSNAVTRELAEQHPRITLWSAAEEFPAQVARLATAPFETAPHPGPAMVDHDQQTFLDQLVSAGFFAG